MNRTQWILAAILAVQILLLAGSRFSTSGGGNDAGLRPFLPALDSFTAARIEISEGNGEKSVALKRDGEGWVLEQNEGYPADAERVDRMLDNLRELRVRRPVLGSSRYHETFEVAEAKHERRFRAWEDASGDPAIDVFFGTSPNHGIRHARLDGDDRVFELRGLDYYDIGTESGSWIEKELMDIPDEDVVGIMLSNAHGEFELELRDGNWEIVGPAAGGKQLDVSEIDSLVGSLSGLRLVEPAGRVDPKSQGFENPAARIEIRYQVISETAEEPDSDREPEVAESEDEGGEAAPAFFTETRSVTVLVGAVAGEESEGRRYVSREGFDHASILSKYEAEQATEAKLADLLRDEAP